MKDLSRIHFLPFTFVLLPRLILPFALVLILSACNALPQPIEPTATRHFTAETLAPTEVIQIQNSQELYGDNITDGQSNPTAAALPVDAAMPPLQSGSIGDTGAEAIRIFLEDGTAVNGNLYENGSTDARTAGILIIGHEPETWGSLPSELFDAGYTVLVVNLTGLMRAEDMDVLLTSLSENGSVDPARIATIGAEESADMATLGCAIYEICDAVVMLSPQSRSAILNVLPNFNPRPMFIAVSQNDAESYATGSAIATSFSPESRFVEQSTGSGTGLLTLNSELSVMIINWLSTVWR